MDKHILVRMKSDLLIKMEGCHIQSPFISKYIEDLVQHRQGGVQGDHGSFWS